MAEAKQWTMRAVARSQDRRTNVWSVSPPCGHAAFNPQTTMLSTQVVECPRCGRRAWADYNADKIEDYDDQP